MLNVLIIDGTSRKNGETRKLARLIAARFTAHGASAVLFDQEQNRLPLFDDSDEGEKDPAVQSLFASVQAADVIVLCSPEYHNSMSSTMKNALDWLHSVKSSFAGKLVGLAGGGGSFGASGAMVQMMMAVRAMHGWLMPEVLVNVPGVWNAFENANTLKPAPLDARVDQFVEKLLDYGEWFKSRRDARSGTR